jgi:hypothetical protein
VAAACGDLEERRFGVPADREAPSRRDAKIEGSNPSMFSFSLDVIDGHFCIVAATTAGRSTADRQKTGGREVAVDYCSADGVAALGRDWTKA